MHVYACINAKAGEGKGLTDDGVSSHVLADDSHIAA